MRFTPLLAQRLLCFATAVAVLTTVPGTALRAQDSPTPKEPPPTAPFVARVPDWCSWTVTYRPRLSAASAGPASPATAKLSEVPTNRLRTVQVTKTGNLRRDVETWDDNLRMERWISGGVELRWSLSQPPFLLVSNPGSDLEAHTYGNTDHGVFTWLDLKHYKGVATVAGRRCHLFHAKPTLAVSDDAAIFEGRAETLDRRAWIDVETRQPVAYDDGEATRLYQFDVEKPAPLVVPEKMAGEFRRHNLAIRDPLKHARVR